MLPMIEGFVCTACRSGRVALHYLDAPGRHGVTYELVRCRTCGVVVVWPPPTEAFLASFYSSGYDGRVKRGIILRGEDFAAANSAVIRDGAVKLATVERLAAQRPGGDLLDIGCGYGLFVHAARARGYRAAGIDLDTEALRTGCETMALDLAEMPIEGIRSRPASYDVITAWQVIEHLRMPRASVAAVTLALRPGGVFAGAVPNIGGVFSRIMGKRWYLLVPPEHLNYFNESSLRRMLHESGFSPCFVGTIPLYASPYFSFGIRAAVMRFGGRTRSPALRRACSVTQRGLTLLKRHFIYRMLNAVVMTAGLGGNSLFFVAKKPSPTASAGGTHEDPEQAAS